MSAVLSDRTPIAYEPSAATEPYWALELALLEAHARAEDADARRQALARADAIVVRLGAELDGRHGGELARRLTALYGFMREELRAMRGTADGERMEELLELAVTLRVAAEAGRRG